MLDQAKSSKWTIVKVNVGVLDLAKALGWVLSSKYPVVGVPQ